MNFSDATKSYFLKAFDFKGRASRSEYWYAYLFHTIVIFIACGIDFYFLGYPLYWLASYGPISKAATLFLLIPYWAVSFRRFHDLNKSVLKWVIMPYISFYTLLGLLMLLGLSGAFDSGALETIYIVLTIIFILGAIGLVLYSLFLFIIFFFRGSVGPNKYGPDPLESAQSDKPEEDLTIWNENK